MTIFYYGADSYRLRQARDEIVQRYKAKYPSGFNFFSFDISDADSLDRLKDAIESLSFFGEHKLIVIRNVFSKKSQADATLKYINQYNLLTASDITLLLAEDYSDKDIAGKHQELFKLLLDKSSLVKNIEPLSGIKLEEWVKQEFKTRNCTIDASALNKLMSITGNDTWRLSNEIEKLSDYKNDEKIIDTDIDCLVHRSIDMNIFNLIDAIAQKNRSSAIKLLYQEMKTGQDPYYILTMIVHQFRNILMAKDLRVQGYSENEISKKAKLHPFVVKKSLNSPFNPDEAAKIYSHLLVIDTGFKMGRIDLEDSLYRLVV